MLKQAIIGIIILLSIISGSADGSCPYNTARLFNGTSSSHSGIVQICNSSYRWSDVCDYYWSQYHSLALCKELGYTNTKPLTIISREPSVTGKFSAYGRSSCSSSSTRLSSCLRTNSYYLNHPSYCDKSKDAVYVNCEPETYQGCCRHGDIRLYNTSDTAMYKNTSMLQMCSVAGSWTSVCGYSWPCSYARVACKHLGYPSTYKPKYFLNVGGWTDMGYGPFTSCSTSYTKLTSCSNYTSSYRYNNNLCDIVKRTVFLQCVETKSECVSYSVRLVGGNDTSEGQVEICYGGRWYSFCGTSYMSNTFAATICNQLGFTSNNFFTYITDGRYGNTGSEIFQGNTYCSRPYNNIRSCSLSLYNSQCINTCNYNNRLGLKCHKSDNCNEGDVRLVNGTVEREGRLEVCASGVWGSICSYNFKRSAAYVACRQLGYTNTDGATIYYSHTNFGFGDGPFVYNYIDCFGNEKSIDKCVKHVGSTNCGTSVVGIRCLESCDNGELRLVGGNKSSEGTVEICLENYWYLISTVGWDDKDAQVVCRQLKYNSGKAVLGSKYGKPKRPLAYRGVNCRGSEAELIDCSHHRVSSSLNTVIGNDSVAGVNCSGSIGSGIPRDKQFNTTTSLMCNTDKFGLKGCSQVCKESTNDCIGSRLYEFSGHCTCASCASSHAKPEFEMSISLDDAKNYRCDAYCKKMMKNCFDGICDKSKNACVCRYCNGV